MITLHVPSERDAGLRVWLIYADIRRTMKTKNVFSLYRALSPFPGYLASAWGDSKQVLADKSFQRACDGVSQRATALLRGIPSPQSSISPQRTEARRGARRARNGG